MGAVEDLMREHGVLRRALLVYSACAAKLRTAAASVPPAALRKTAELFRTFGEDYHERKLEDEMGDKFEDIEHEQFGKDGFESAVTTIAAIEQSLGLADIAQFTAATPPKA